MRNPRLFTMIGTVFAAAMSATALTPITANAADAMLSGTIKSADGAALGGVTVSARLDGSNMVTSVFTDETGNYYFPPLAAGKYKVWAQAITFDTGRGDVDLSAAKRQDFTLKPLKDFVRQLPGDMVLAALPDATPEDANMKTIVQNNCTACHTPSYILQHKFDEAGWNAIINLMKHANVYGVYQGPDHKASPVLDHNQKQLAAYLARARGPGETSMKFNLRPRPTGEAARAVFREYDFPIEGGRTLSNDGSDWSFGTPSRLNHVPSLHDAQMDFDGNVWITFDQPNLEATVAKLDTRTGAVKNFKLDDMRGFAVGSHGITLDEKGILWFNTRSNVQRGLGGLGRIDPKTEKITVYLPPRTTSGTAGTLDSDLSGSVWVTAPDGAFRFDTSKETFTEFKSLTYKNDRGTAMVYGLSADRTGNGWWLLMTQDLVDYSDVNSGKTGEFKLPP